MRTSRQQLNHPLKAFTLVELLVVVSIIALLLSILLPSMNKVRESVQNVSCMNNLKSIGRGLLMYTSDHRDHLPPYAIVYGGGPSSLVTWYHMLQEPYLSGPEPHIVSGSATNIDELHADERPGWQLCPSKLPPDQLPNMSGRLYAGVGYGWNFKHFGLNASDTSYAARSERKRTNAEAPDRTIVIGDSLDIPANYSQNFYVYAQELVNVGVPRADWTSRHNGSGNYLMLGGNTESFSPPVLADRFDYWWFDKEDAYP